MCAVFVCLCVCHLLTGVVICRSLLPGNGNARPPLSPRPLLLYLLYRRPKLLLLHQGLSSSPLFGAEAPTPLQFSSVHHSHLPSCQCTLIYFGAHLTVLTMQTHTHSFLFNSIQYNSALLYRSCWSDTAALTSANRWPLTTPSKKRELVLKEES